MKRLLRYLFHRPTWHKLPPLPRMYSSEYQLSEVDRDTETLMCLTHTRCPQGVRLLEKRYRADAHTLIQTLPARRRKRQIKARAMALVRRALGLLSYDPMKSIARQHMRRGRR